MTKLTLRKLCLEDAQAFHELRKESLIDCPEGYGMGLEKWIAAPLSAVESMIEACLSDAEGPLIGAFMNEELVGHVGVKLIGREKVRHMGTLWGLFVHPHFRRQKIAQALVKQIIAECKSMKDLEQIRLMVCADSIPAVTLFESKSFKHYGVEPRGRKVGETYYDLIYMWRMLEVDGHQ